MPVHNVDDKYVKLVRAIPINRLFLETDSMPEIKIEDIYLQVAEIKGMPLEELQERIILNANTFFNR